MFMKQELNEETERSEKYTAIPIEEQIQQEESKSYHMHQDKGTVEMLLTPSLLQDAALHRKQLKFLSKTAISLTKKVYEQQEKIAQMAKQTEYYREQHQSNSYQNHSLKSQLAQLREKEKELQRLLLERQHLIEESKNEQEVASSIRLAKLHEFQQQAMKLLSKNQEQASILQHKEEEIQIKDAEIERLKQRFHRLQLQLQHQNSIKASEKDQKQIEILKNKVRQISDNYANLTHSYSILQQQNLQLKRQLKEVRQSYEENSQITLLNFKNSSQYSAFKTQIQARDQALSDLHKNYKTLKHNYSLLKNERDYLKQRYQSLKKDQKDIEHAIIDRFNYMLAVIQQNLQKAEVYGITDNIKNKKNALLRRLEREYEIFMKKFDGNRYQYF